MTNHGVFCFLSLPPERIPGLAPPRPMPHNPFNFGLWAKFFTGDATNVDGYTTKSAHFTTKN